MVTNATQDTLIQVTLPDGAVRETPCGTTGKGVAELVGKRLAADALAIEVDGRVRDLSAPLERSASVRILTFKDPQGRAVLRHSAGHVLAQAVMDLFPGAAPAAGDWSDERYFYDFQVPRPFTAEDLERIEARMGEIRDSDVPFERLELPPDQALHILGPTRNPFKEEMISELDRRGETISCYRQGNWVDLCLGPHAPSTGRAGAFKLLMTAGAYWHGDETQPQLQRVYLTAFPSHKELEEYLARIEEAKKRDHRKLGQELDLFTISPDVGQGLVLWMPKGAALRYELESFLRQKLMESGYQSVYTPHIGKLDLYRTSGHFPYYKDSQYPPIHMREHGSEDDASEEGYLLKPMNCPHHIKIYEATPKSYRDLPYRLAEFGTVYRYEQSGELSGMTRVRGFTQDDAHLFVTPDQLEEELAQTVELVLFVLRSLNFGDYRIRFGRRDPSSDKYGGHPEQWDRAESNIRNVLRGLSMDFSEELGEAAFYGPKIDFVVRDCLNREWQLGTVQVDYVLPERFSLKYIGSDGEVHRPIMIHRAPFGSFERFVGILIEHYAGAFPAWLAPVQARVLPVVDEVLPYAREVYTACRLAGLRAELDERSEKIGYKIRSAETEKVPLMLVVGKREAERRAVALRVRSQGDQGVLPLEEAMARLVVEAARPSGRNS
ncbi:MAG: Threonine--tRNA ligase [bacterium]|nr:Threonine--tRNA ligase [bacterium]